MPIQHGTPIGYLTDDPKAKMSWTLEEYLVNVVGGCNQKVDGWPEHITFQNLSDIKGKGGTAQITYLLHLWETGKMRFVQLTDDERKLYRADPTQFAPAPNCAHSKARRTRPDLGTRRKARRDPRGTLLYGPPKSAVEIEDSDIEDADVFSSSPAQAPTQAAELSDDIESSDGFALEESAGDELSDDIEDADGCLLWHPSVQAELSDDIEDDVDEFPPIDTVAQAELSDDIEDADSVASDASSSA